MTILSDKSIIKLIANKEISIEPFKEANLTPNGYDLTVGEIEIPDEDAENLFTVGDLQNMESFK